MHLEQICDRETEERANEQICIAKLIASLFFNFANAPKIGMDPETGNLGTVFLLDSCITSTHEKKKKFLNHGTKFLNHGTKSCILLFREVPVLSPDLGNGYPNRYAFALFSPTKQIL